MLKIESFPHWESRGAKANRPSERMKNMNDYLSDNRPYCRRAEKDCSARSKSGRCNALCNAKFGSKPCPFYKTWEQQKVEHQVTYERLIVLERYDLLETYRPEEYGKKKAQG